ncbi:thioredoxin domain-containing protein [Spirosoma flavum]|uniref:Thioredoxin n=1 Tax=Spirosoma flavum TaxID=2048557 RepID=A0ABW6AJ24_9BACT
MKPDERHPILISGQSAVLLIFMPPERADHQLKALLTALATSVQAHFGLQIRVLKIDELNHADVVRSFAITHTPSFVLVRMGVELWRQESLPNEPALILLIQRLLHTENHEVR